MTELALHNYELDDHCYKVRLLLAAALTSTLVLGAGDFSLKLGGFGLGGIGTATFGSIILYALLRRKPAQQPAV